MAKYRPPKRFTRRRLGKWALGALGAIAVILITAIAGATITTGRVDSATSWVSGLFSGGKPRRSEAEIVIGRVFENVRRAQFWEGRPTLYASSKRYLIEHFKEYDPRESHGSYLLPQEPVLSPSALAVAMPVYAGNRITVLDD